MKKEKQIKRKKVPVVKVGTHRKTVISLWILLFISVSFSVYKNFTAIDIHTIHEEKVIEKEVIDTNRIENFVKNFAKKYFSWENNRDSIDRRTLGINEYLTTELQELNTDTVRLDIPTSVKVNDVQIWEIKQVNEHEFTVIYSVDQTVMEGEQSNQLESTYSVMVYVDDSGNMVIIKNPTICSKPLKSNYEPQMQETDGTVEAVVMDEVSEFLQTFFKLYPTATEQELSYYVKENTLPSINGAYIFSELVNPVYSMDGDIVNVSLSLKYLDQKTKAIQISQFHLKLQKTDNWMIVG